MLSHAHTNMTILMLYVFINFACSHMWSAICVYVAEALPTDVRGTGCSIAWLFARAGATIMPIVTGFVEDSHGILGFSPTVSALDLNAGLALLGIFVAVGLPHETSNCKMVDSYQSP